MNVVAMMLTSARPPRTAHDLPIKTLAEGDEAARHAAFRHDRAGQYKERDRQHREFADAARYLQHHRLERDVDPQRAGKRRQRQGM